MYNESVLNREWDNLIVLDCCRYDDFEKVNWLEGKLEKIWSKGGQTVDWFRGTFEPRMYDGIVYYSANPHISKQKLPEYHEGVGFHEHYLVLSNKIKRPKVGFPEDINGIVFDTYNKYPDKRKVIHYMQPHTPFLVGKLKNKGNGTLARMFYKGQVSMEDIKEGYRENTKHVLTYAEKLLTVLQGKTVITADHGECHGEDDLWGHSNKSVFPDGEIRKVKGMLKHPKLREVPYFTVQDENDKIEESLKDLGYM